MICGMMTLQASGATTYQNTTPSQTNFLYQSPLFDKSLVAEIDVFAGVFDTLYVTSPYAGLTLPITSTAAASLQWGLHTIMLAKYEGNLSAGNLVVDYLQSQIESVKIKRRKKGVINDWVTVAKIPVNSENDLKFTLRDYYTQAKTTYEYSYGISLGNIELDMQMNKTVYSDFDGIYILDKNNVFNTPLDVTFSSTKNHPSEIVQPINSQFPVHVSCGGANYYSGSASGTFIALDIKNHSWKVDDGVNYRQKLMAFLCNGKPKILKYRDGRIWIIGITDNPSESEQNHPDKIQTSFSWTQIGEANDFDDLYYNGFIDWEV